MRGFVTGLALVACSGCGAIHPGGRTGVGASPVGAVVFNEAVLSEASARGAKVVDRNSARPAASFDDPRSMLRAVLAASPARAVVYPTERYYYYRMPLGPRLVSGNIRFAEVEQGVISIGYFDSQHPVDMKTREFRNGEDGVRLEFDGQTHEVLLSFEGISRVFVLDQEAFEPPDFPLLPGERYVSGVRDESGYYFHLLYWPPDRSFYYVLNTSKPCPESWSRGESSTVETWWGDWSRFCFLRDPRTGRFILVGVHQREIRENSWYDGPFDQVPPNLPIREILEEAYPYVIDAGGIDEHGNFLKMAGQRVAISPYQEYVSGPDLERFVANAVRDTDTPLAWTRATYEHKRDWRAPAEYPIGAHTQPVSSAWPANHWGANSGSWGNRHEAATSATWPANHAAETSRNRP
jgi:hypothetical protein